MHADSAADDRAAAQRMRDIDESSAAGRAAAQRMRDEALREAGILPSEPSTRATETAYTPKVRPGSSSGFRGEWADMAVRNARAAAIRQPSLMPFGSALSEYPPPSLGRSAAERARERMKEIDRAFVTSVPGRATATEPSLKAGERGLGREEPSSLASRVSEIRRLEDQLRDSQTQVESLREASAAEVARLTSVARAAQDGAEQPPI